MTDQQLNFTQEFKTPTPEEWKAEVERALKGAPFDKKMLTRTHEGLTLRPLYTRHDWPSAGDPSGFPGAMPFTRGGTAAGSRPNDWDVRQVYSHPCPVKGNATILHELNRGVRSLMLMFDGAAQAGLDGDASGAAELAGAGGIMLYSVDDLDRLLDDVDLRLVPVSLAAGGQSLAAAALLAALWRRRGVGAGDALGAFNADPLGALAAGGSLPASLEDALAQMAALARYTQATYAQVSAVAVNTTAYHDAGATEAQDLGILLATAVAYLKAMTAAGLTVDQACRQIAFTLAVPCDQFLAIAKLRAARKLWARVAEACGASEPARAMHLTAVSASRMMTTRDAWVNMLRTTVACFAAAVGGADAVIVQPFNTALGVPDELGLRVARNTHIVLAEESNIAKVIDPAGGSWYVESRTDELARAAWNEFQGIEKAGGIAQVLTDGTLAAAIAKAWGEREAGIAKRRDPITGVSEFPNIGEAPVATEEVDAAAVKAAAGERLRATRAKNAGPKVEALAKAGVAERPAAAVAAAEAGATIGQMAQALAGTPAKLTALPRHRYGEAFEALRAASDAYLARTGVRPSIFLANLGAIAQHTARATFAKNFFETAGITALPSEGFTDAAACAEAFKASGARIAILCSADPIYEQMAAAVAGALKAAGCEYLFLAGQPGDKRDLYTGAGIDDFIFMGADVLKITGSTLARLGVIER
jgi:methylmalonyl-CoA mutase